MAFLLLTYYWVLLRTRPRTILQTATRATPVATAEPPPRDSNLNSILSAVQRAAELHPFRPQCLEQALATRVLLSVTGENARVTIGVSKSGHVFAAHAWVEVGGLSNDGSQPRFVAVAHLR